VYVRTKNPNNVNIGFKIEISKNPPPAWSFSNKWTKIKIIEITWKVLTRTTLIDLKIEKFTIKAKNEISRTKNIK
jgi:hypothetical protein